MRPVLVLPRYIQAADGSGACLNADNCNTDLIVFPTCPTTGCCNNCDNMIFKLDATTGFIKAGANGTSCVVGSNPLSLGACTADAAVTFKYNASTSQLASATGDCFSQV